MRVLVIIPAYREEKTIAAVICAVKAQHYEVLVIDDCSPDRTGEIARQNGAIVLRLVANLQYGGALQAGYLYARDNNYGAVVQLDADGQHDPACIPDLLAPILSGEADVSMGSRFLGGQNYPMPMARKLGQWLFGGIAQWQTGLKITDPTTGFQALSRKVINASCTNLFSEDFPDADMIITLHRMGFRIKEVPVRMYASKGASMHSGIIRPLYYIYKMTLAMLVARFRTVAKEFL